MKCDTEPVLNLGCYEKVSNDGKTVFEGVILGVGTVQLGNRTEITGMMYSEDFGRQTVIEGEDSMAGWKLVWYPPYHDEKLEKFEAKEADKEAEAEKKAPVAEPFKPTKQRRRRSRRKAS